MSPSVASPPSLRLIAARVERRLGDLLAAESTRWRALDPALEAPLAAIEALVTAGGKRLRPAFCHWGFVAAGGDPEDPRVVDAGAAFEMLHAFALVHDDVMDGSAVRRGRPAAHAAFAARHRAAGWRGEERRFGEGAAVLAGDLAHVYADRLLGDVPVQAAAVWDELRVELNIGQYLDLVATARADRDGEVARRIARYKSGRYTVERPLHLGAALAGRLAELQGGLSAYGGPVGEAFQLRDDVLGVFGDPLRTGKPVGEDLREGKPTVLMALAVERSRAAKDAAALAVLDRVGDPGLDDAGVLAVQRVLVDVGALAEVEARIERLTTGAVDALEVVDVAADARGELVDLARFVAARDS
ncbi:MAG TPA: polyprenyl synthetase family protein [Acidimicrobiales bacterium]|nr:polyprenyl synthetase family protein [Acidimicrobiales bacterium]